MKKNFYQYCVVLVLIMLLCIPLNADGQRLPVRLDNREGNRTANVMKIMSRTKGGGFRQVPNLYHSSKVSLASPFKR
ncbi:MAG: hypothetical protein HUK05_03110, partial [Prevotella sp.]|nr:hypothetical protein [Prevotella sp.]